MLRKALLACMAALAGISTAIGAEYTLTTGISYTPSGGSATIVDGYTNPNVEDIEYESRNWPSSINAASLDFTITLGGLYGADAIEENGLFSLDSLVIKVSGAKWCQDEGRTITLTSGDYTYTAELEGIFSGPGGTDGNAEGFLELNPEDFFLSKDSEVAVSIRPASERPTDNLSVATANIQGKNEATVSWSGVSGIDIKSDWNNEAPLVQVSLTTATPGSGGTQLNLPDSSDFTWIAGSNASGIGTGASAEIVQKLATAITASNIGNTDLTGWFAGTGQAYAQNSYPDDISITSEDSFTFKCRPALSGEYVALGVELTEYADSITLTFDNDKKAGYSVWSYDKSTSTATELIANTGLTAAGTVNATYNTATVAPSQIFVVWTSNPSTGNAGGGQAITISNIALSYEAAPGYYYWKGSGDGSWASSNWASPATGTGTFQIPGNTDSTTVNAIFNNASDTVTIDVNGEVSVDLLSVQAGNYTFDGTSATTDSISATEIEVSKDATMGLSDIGINSTITNSGTVNLSGTINLVDFQAVGGSVGIPAVNGYSNTTTTYRVVDGGTIAATNVTWLIDGTAAASGSTTFTDGVLSVTVPDTTYYVSSSELVYDGTTGDAAGAAGIALNGNTLKLGVDITGDDDFITATEAGGTLDLNGKTLDQSSLGALAGETILKGDTSSTYNLGSDTALATKLSLGPYWAGKVTMEDVSTPTAALDLSTLGKDGSSIELGIVDVKKLTSTSTAALSAKSLKVAETSAVGGNLELTDGPLTLGGESAAEMTVNGDVGVDRIVLGNAGSSLTAGKLVTGASSITIGVASQDVLDALNAQALNQDITIITLDEAYAGGATLDTTVPVSLAVANAAGKYETELVWSSDHKQLQYKASVVSGYVSNAIKATSSNGQLGADMLQSALEEENPQVNAPESGLARALDAVDNGTLTDEGAAAIAGASTAVLGMAAHGDLDRQLQAIRNRTTTMGVDQSVVHHDMPYFNAWINAEGDYSELSDDGTEGGYKLNSWGGTVGFDVDITPTFTAGMALTAMYGDLTISGADDADGDLNTYYVSAFARYCASAWTHTFVASVGMSEFKLSRNIMGAEQESDTNGLSFGLMYEVGRVFALNEDGTACLQPIFNVTWRHTTVDGYEEEGSNLALEVDDQTLDTITLGLGARLQAVVGESMYNRTSIFEARILGKFDAGDTNGTSEVSLAGVTGEVESAERGAFGLEIGAGLTIPMGDEGGSLFMDASLELRADYTNVNGTVGYRVNF